MRCEKSCGGLVFRKQKDLIQLLLIKHKKGGHWSFPKGHVEDGESEHETAKREILEETGIHVHIKDGYREKVFYSPKPDVNKEVIYFFCISDWVDPTPQEEEISCAQWFDLGECMSRVTYWNDKRLIRKALKKIKKESEILFQS